MTLTELQTKAHKTALDHGFWTNDNIPEKLMLVVSELGEACEALRGVKPMTASKEDFEKIEALTDSFNGTFKMVVKDTFGDELADSIIRIADLAERLGIDLDAHVRLKMRYNEGRPLKHGKKF